MSTIATSIFLGASAGLKVVAVAVDALYNAAAFAMLLLIADESNRLGPGSAI